MEKVLHPIASEYALKKMKDTIFDFISQECA